VVFKLLTVSNCGVLKMQTKIDTEFRPKWQWQS
jgi:hypothetical protein